MLTLAGVPPMAYEQGVLVRGKAWKGATLEMKGVQALGLLQS